MAKSKKGIRKAVVTGITGQDGSYLTELLLGKGYEVHGIVRRSSTWNRERIDHLYKRDDSTPLKLHYGDMTDPVSLTSVLKEVQPDEIYNLAAQSHVAVSFETPLYTGQVDAIGTLNLLEAVRQVCPKAKVYQASTSELFSGLKKDAPYDETSPFLPRSPYGVAKLYAYNICRVYRESYGLFISNGILFNHESPRRGDNFVTKKIVNGVWDIMNGYEKKLHLGNLYAVRDWGYAPEYVEAMWRMLQLEEPTDLVIATGEAHTVAEFAKEAFSCADMDWKKYVVTDKQFERPNEVSYLLGNPAKAKKLIGWKPEVKFKGLIKIMMDDVL